MHSQHGEDKAFMWDQKSADLEGKKFCINNPHIADEFNLFQRDIKLDSEYLTFVLPKRKTVQTNSLSSFRQSEPDPGSEIRLFLFPVKCFKSQMSRDEWEMH